MSLPHSDCTNASSAFDRLDYEIRRWIWKQKWMSLRDIQEYAIPVILNQQDVIIAASTASGKTEAAFFPILTKLLELSDQSPTAIYISPLKALINDQWDRLELLCNKLNIPVTPWHGDVSATKKRRFLKNPNGCLLITPESLEALFMHYGYEINSIFSNLQYCVIDEVHAFLGNERGKQLQSLLHRLDIALNKKTPRIGLSATIGDLTLAAQYLRYDAPESVKIISSANNASSLKVALYGYKNSKNITTDTSTVPFDDFVAQKLFTALRGTNNLIFPNTRQYVEIFSDKLRQLCEDHSLPNEFWPHHGNLAKSIREETEQALKKKEYPATAICTNTLELGIDIGAVKSVVQIGSPPSVSSLRQRIGRSGRKPGESAILRAFNIENDINSTLSISDQLREQLVQSIACIELLLEKWCEPVGQKGLHLSTFIQQLLSIIVQYGGLTVGNCWKILCDSSIFSALSKEDFLSLLTHLGNNKVIMQDHTGLLLLDELGEKFVNHYSFYASFASDEEFKLICEGKTLGTLPVKRTITLDSYLIFAGKRWRICNVDEQQKVIIVTPDKGGVPPSFSGDGMRTDGEIRKKMRKILGQESIVLFCDNVAASLLDEARFYYQQLDLENKFMLKDGKNILLFLWDGDVIQDTIALFFISKGYKSLNQGLFISIESESIENIIEELNEFVNSGCISEIKLAEFAEIKQQEKWDWLLPEDLLCKNYASQYLDLPAAKAAVLNMLKK